MQENILTNVIRITKGIGGIEQTRLIGSVQTFVKIFLLVCSVFIICLHVMKKYV